MKYYYEDEKNTGMVICNVVGVFILIIGLVFSGRLPFSWDLREDAPLFGSAEWIEAVVPIILAVLFIVWCGRVLNRQALNHRKWHRYLVKNGIKCQGTVKDVIKEESPDIQNNTASTGYRFLVSYYSPAQRQTVTFETPILSFSTEKIDRVSCDVYEVTEKPSWAEGWKDPTDDAVKIEGNRITVDINPFRLAKRANQKSYQKWFGNVVADNFKGM